MTRRLSRSSLWLVVVAFVALGTACGSDGSGDRGQSQYIEPPAPDAVLDTALRYPDPYVRAETARLLAFAPSARPEGLARLLGDDDPLVALVAADGLLNADPSSAVVIERLQALLASESEAVQRAVIDVVARRMALDPAVKLLNAALDSPASQPATRRDAMQRYVELVASKSTPVAIARKLERKLSAYATDADPAVAGLALAQIGVTSRLAGEHSSLRGSLKELARSESVPDRIRALQVLTAAHDSELKSIAYQPFVDAGPPEKKDDTAAVPPPEQPPELKRLRAVAAVALGSAGDKFRVDELEVLSRRDSDRELQLAAIGALVRIDTTDSRLAVASVLENPTSEIRLHTLQALLESSSNVTVPDDVLRDERAEVRVLGLQVIWKHDPDRFARLIKQKLGVDSFRAPILRGLADWLDDLTWQPGGLKALPPWLGVISDEVIALSNEADRPRDMDSEAAMATLLGYLLERGDLERIFRDASFGGQYAILRHFVRTNTASDVFEEARASAWFSVQLAAAVGVAR